MRVLPFLIGLISVVKRSASFTLHHTSPTPLTLTKNKNAIPSSGRSLTTPMPIDDVFRTPLSSLHMSSDEKFTRTEPRSLNEFSRPYRTEIVLGARRREYATQISATPEELERLAKRFSLSKISKLDADIVLKRDQPVRGGGGGGMGDFVQVRGDVVASVTQTCVRTNEDFEVELEFNLAVIVRACIVQGFNEIGGSTVEDMDDDLPKKVKETRKRKKRRGKNLGTNGQALDQMKMTEIEGLLQGADEDEEVVEDLAIFADDGILDAGELVAQSFRLKLDPYPKKPGTEPVSYSITG